MYTFVTTLYLRIFKHAWSACNWFFCEWIMGDWHRSWHAARRVAIGGGERGSKKKSVHVLHRPHTEQSLRWLFVTHILHSCQKHKRASRLLLTFKRHTCCTYLPPDHGHLTHALLDQSDFLFSCFDLLDMQFTCHSLLWLLCEHWLHWRQTFRQFKHSV